MVSKLLTLMNLHKPEFCGISVVLLENLLSNVIYRWFLVNVVRCVHSHFGKHAKCALVQGTGTLKWWVGCVVS